MLCRQHTGYQVMILNGELEIYSLLCCKRVCWHECAPWQALGLYWSVCVCVLFSRASTLTGRAGSLAQRCCVHLATVSVVSASVSPLIHHQAIVSLRCVCVFPLQTACGLYPNMAMWDPSVSPPCLLISALVFQTSAETHFWKTNKSQLLALDWIWKSKNWGLVRVVHIGKVMDYDMVMSV